MKQIETEILIKAKPERVWDILANFEDHPKWNPFIRSITGKKEVGEKITVTLQPPNSSSMTIKPVILAFNPGNEFRWKGKLGIRGIFDGEHYFKLIEQGKVETKFIHGEKFKGIMVPLVGKTLNKTEEGFELMNRSLKEESEKD
jgi:hypothetical protein